MLAIHENEPQDVNEVLLPIAQKKIKKIPRRNSETNVRLARYYRSSLSSRIDGPGEQSTTITASSTTTNPAMKRSLSDQPLLRKFKNSAENENNFETQKQKSNAISAKEAPNHEITTIDYEYPSMVASLKHSYKELGITSLLYLVNIISAVGIVIVNKFIFNHFKFPHGLVLTFYHFVLTSIGLHILAALKFFPVKPVKLLKILPLSISFCSYVVLTNLSLLYNSGTFYQVTFTFNNIISYPHRF